METKQDKHIQDEVSQDSYTQCSFAEDEAPTIIRRMFYNTRNDPTSLILKLQKHQGISSSGPSISNQNQHSK